MNERQKVYEMLERFESAMLVTRNPDGLLDARPMRVADVEPSGPLWFMTARSSRKVGEIEKDSRVLLVYQDAERPVPLDRRNRAHRRRRSPDAAAVEGAVQGVVPQGAR